MSKVFKNVSQNVHVYVTFQLAQLTSLYSWHIDLHCVEHIAPLHMLEH